jgi:hypothetical protein
MNWPVSDFKELRWEDFSGGKNTRFPSTQIQRNEGQDCLNVYSDLRKALVKRPGYTAYATDGATGVTTFWAYNKIDGAGNYARYLLKAAGTAVRAWNGSVWADVATGLATGLRYGYAEANNKSYFANGTDGLKSWDGTTLATVAGAPTGIWYLVWHKNRVYAATGKSSRLYFTDLGDPTSWPVLNFIDFDIDDGDKVTGIRSLPDGALLITKEHSRHILRGSGPGNYTTLSFRDGVGCVSHWAMASVPEANRLAFLDREGVYLTDGAHVQLISDHITPDLRAWPQGKLALACLEYYNYHLHLSVPNGPTDIRNTYLWLWDERSKGWWPWNIPASHLLNYFDGTTEMLLASSGTTGALYQLWNGDNDNGVAINAFWIGKDDDADQPTRIKRYKRGFATEKAVDGTHSVTVVWNQDFGAHSTSFTVPVNNGTFPVFDVAVFDTALFVSMQGITNGKTMVPAQSAYVRPEVYQPGKNEPFAILNLVLEMKVTERRVG